MVLAGFELIRLAQVHLVHLRVVFDFARLHQAGIERLLLVRRIAVDAMRVEQIWPRSVRTTTGSQWPGSRSTRMSPFSRRWRRSPERGSPGLRSWS